MKDVLMSKFYSGRWLLLATDVMTTLLKYVSWY